MFESATKWSRIWTTSRLREVLELVGNQIQRFSDRRTIVLSRVAKPGCQEHQLLADLHRVRLPTRSLDTGARGAVKIELEVPGRRAFRPASPRAQQNDGAGLWYKWPQLDPDTKPDLSRRWPCLALTQTPSRAGRFDTRILRGL